VVTDLVQIRHLAENEERENLQFRRYLKDRHTPEGLFRRIAHEVEEQIDCKACANCCRETRVNVSRTDVEALARPGNAARTGHQEIHDPGSEDREIILRQTTDGCVFLRCNLCTVYEAWLRARLEFPYLVSHQRSLGGRMSSVCKHASILPDRI
jgi:hypothetical protein